MFALFILKAPNTYSNTCLSLKKTNTPTSAPGAYVLFAFLNRIACSSYFYDAKIIWISFRGDFFFKFLFSIFRSGTRRRLANNFHYTKQRALRMCVCWAAQFCAERLMLVGEMGFADAMKGNFIGLRDVSKGCWRGLEAWVLFAFLVVGPPSTWFDEWSGHFSAKMFSSRAQNKNGVFVITNLNC